ncbi:right-handed parallel beta-helix repeat-containing protein [Mesorhizobium sp. BH1-1-4]|uniref:right-handed parallel beta-helix repeat-containing protein n=1 Tax=Mesorhizobium sp. BH1-1-4 TaxID=2876662 RepID=UPI001CD090A2|nr:right-handed parallel beta-helix repeat-containing protein [Mesorhizobium sp. BH1-1-4]MBZ9993082.1 right-handed parallel beta-helix repeat-containing protein [Mesorhizobium sp. BH1-1-4]
MTITTDGTVIDGKIIDGSLRITASNVVIKNCVITYNDWWGVDADGAKNVTVQNSTITGPGNQGTSTGVILGSGNFIGNNISGGEHGIVLTDGASVVKGNYLHDGGSALADPHIGGISLKGGQNNVLIEDNTVIGKDTSDIFLQNTFGPITNVTINHNYLAGDVGYNIYVEGRFDTGPTTGVSITNNYIVKGFYGYYSTSEASPAISGNTEVLPGATPTPTPDPDPAPVPTPPPEKHTFFGTSGNDVFHGTTGIDTMTGGLGNDTYYADNAGDKVVEAKNGGNDTVLASVSYALSAGSQVEHLATTNPAGTTPIDLTGNEFAQTIDGNAGANTIDGRGGADTMTGYGGNDTYIVDNVGDKVIEKVGGGEDSVRASVSFALSAGSEVEHLATTNAAGTTAINLTGNEFAQTIDGNAGANTIDGRGGADTMTGYGGNDTYIVDNIGDKVIEKVGGGEDSVRASVSYALSAGSEIEHLATTNQSGRGAINLAGNEFSQTIKGNAGANVINGGGGADVLTGNGGKDVFVFKAALGAGNVDKITDFSVSQDKILLDHNVFAGLQPGALSGQAFYAGASAHDSTDRIIYNSSTGALYFDSDGSGGAHQIQFATLSAHLPLTASSFVIS